MPPSVFPTLPWWAQFTALVRRAVGASFVGVDCWGLQWAEMQPAYGPVAPAAARPNDWCGLAKWQVPERSAALRCCSI
jgi:hypothetical protein